MPQQPQTREEKYKLAVALLVEIYAPKYQHDLAGPYGDVLKKECTIDSWLHDVIDFDQLCEDIANEMQQSAQPDQLSQPHQEYEPGDPQ